MNIFREVLWPLIAVLAAFVVGGLIVVLIGDNPFVVFYQLIGNSFGSLNDIGYTLFLAAGLYPRLWVDRHLYASRTSHTCLQRHVPGTYSHYLGKLNKRYTQAPRAGVSYAHPHILWPPCGKHEPVEK